MADQLTSLAIVLYDLEFTFCYYLSDLWTGRQECLAANAWTRPLIAGIPACWRLLQCIRCYRDTRIKTHLGNAGKYLVSILVSVFSCLRGNFDCSYLDIVWFTLIVISTGYTFSWDVYFDWGFLRDRTGKHIILRPMLVYRPRVLYYIAIISNLIMRLMWTLTISPEFLERTSLAPDVFTTLLAIVEIIRRAQWNIYRLENQHVANCKENKATERMSVLFHPLNDHPSCLLLTTRAQSASTHTTAVHSVSPTVSQVDSTPSTPTQQNLVPYDTLDMDTEAVPLLS